MTVQANVVAVRAQPRESRFTRLFSRTPGGTDDLVRDPLRLRWGLFALPGVLILSAVFAIPVVALVGKSFFRDAGRTRLEPGFTLDNYIRFFSDGFYWRVLFDTFLLGGVVVTACVLLAYPVAYFLARTQNRHRGLLIFLVVAPLLISVVIRNLGWIPILSSNGLVNWILLVLGIVDEPVKLLNNFTGVVIGLTHSLLPYMVLMLITVIQSIDRSVEEAALNLGATPWQTFLRVILPLSRPGLIGGYLLVLTTAVSAFTTPAVMGGRRVLVLPIYIEQQIRYALQYAFGATAATILLLTTVLLTLMSLNQSREGR